MADIVFNVAKGRLAYYATLPAPSDALVVVPLNFSGLPADGAMADYATLAAILAAGATEQTTIGRKQLNNVTVTVDNANDRVDVDADDLLWTATAGSQIGALVICYAPDYATSPNSALVPLVKYDINVTPNGGDLSVVWPAGGWFRAS